MGFLFGDSVDSCNVIYAVAVDEVGVNVYMYVKCSDSWLICSGVMQLAHFVLDNHEQQCTDAIASSENDKMVFRF